MGGPLPRELPIHPGGAQDHALTYEDRDPRQSPRPGAPTSLPGLRDRKIPISPVHLWNKFRLSK